MLARTILIADNNAGFLESCAQALELSGYRVVRASNPQEATDALANTPIHVAVLDVRLLDDANPDDWSGLTVARAVPPSVATIVLTELNRWELVREALGGAGAKYFVAKTEGVDVLRSYVMRAFNEHVSVNWSLNVAWLVGPPVAIASQLEPSLSPRQLANRAAEVEEIVHRAGVGRESVTLQRILWADGGRVAVLTRFLASVGGEESAVSVFGTAQQTEDEARRYREYASGEVARTDATLAMSVRSCRLGANVYSLHTDKWWQLTAIRDLYRSGSERSVRDAYSSLFGTTLTRWHRGSPVVRDMVEEHAEPEGEDLRDVIGAMSRQSRNAGAVVAVDGDLVKVGLRNWHCEARLSRIQQIGRLPQQPAPFVMVPGSLRGDTIFTDGEGSVWVTDFAQAGLTRAIWPYATTEAQIRFDWELGSEPSSWTAFEEALAGPAFRRLETSAVDRRLRRALRLIGYVRTLAARAGVGSRGDYEREIGRELMRRMAAVARGTADTVPATLAVHLLIACVVMARRSSDGDYRALGRVQTGVELKDGRVFVDGESVTLTPQAFGLLSYLHDRIEQVCTRRELVEMVLGERYDQADSSQVSRLNTAVSRLRERIESASHSCKLIITAAGGGYSLRKVAGGGERQD